MGAAFFCRGVWGAGRQDVSRDRAPGDRPTIGVVSAQHRLPDGLRDDLVLPDQSGQRKLPDQVPDMAVAQGNFLAELDSYLRLG